MKSMPKKSSKEKGNRSVCAAQNIEYVMKVYFEPVAAFPHAWG